MNDTEKREARKEIISGLIGMDNNHVCLSISQGMAGKVRFDVSVNYPTLDESRNVLCDALDVIQEIIAEKELPIQEAVTVERKRNSRRQRSYSERWVNDR